MSAWEAWWHLARPRMVPFLLMLPAFGFAFAHWDRALDLRGADRLVWVLLGWVALHAGTLWLNAVLDRDEGEVLLGRPVPVPRYTAVLGYGALALCVPLAARGSALAGVAAAACAGMAVLYSHPRIAWKGHPVFGPMVNFLGYGLLSPMAGWSAVEVPANPRTVVSWLLFGVGILSPYLLAQAFQGDEDRARGYRTPVVVLGPSRTIQLSRVTMAVVMLGGAALAVVGWFPRVCLVAVPMWWWVDRLLARWAALPDGGSSRWAMRYARRVLVSAAVVVGASFAEYVRQSLADEPVAGLGTAAGHPSDRPRLPPLEMRLWELRNGGVLRRPGGV